MILERSLNHHSLALAATRIQKLKGRWYHIHRPKASDCDWPGSCERERVVIRPLAGARGYRKVQSSQDVGLSLRDGGRRFASGGAAA